MAYDYTATVRQYGDLTIIKLVEVDVAAASEAGGDDNPIVIPLAGEVLLVKSTKISGDATTVLPSAYSATGAAFSDSIFESAGTTAAAEIADAAQYAYEALQSGRMFWRATPDSGTNNVIHSTIIIRGA